MRLNISRWYMAGMVVATAVLAMAVLNQQALAVNDVLAGWTFETSTLPTTTTGTPAPPQGTDNGPLAAEVGSGSASGHHTSATTFWWSPAGNFSSKSYSSDKWNTTTAGLDYWQFQTSSTGAADIGLFFDQGTSTTAPRDFELSYSTNGTSFTPFATYQLPNFQFSTRETNSLQFDLSAVSALDNQASIYFRLTQNSTVSAAGGAVATGGTSRVDNVKIVSNYSGSAPPTPPAAAPAAGGDVLFALNTNGTSLEMVHGSATANGGARVGDPFQGDPFMEAVKFDNYPVSGVPKQHNVRGNVLAANFAVGGNSTGSGGAIYSYGTQGSLPTPVPQLIGNTGPASAAIPGGVQIGQTSLPVSGLSGLSVSPSNNKIAVAANGFASGATTSPGAVYIYDYTAGNAAGSGAALANGRESSSAGAILNPGSSQGTAWIDNNTVVTFNALNGGVWTVDDSAGSGGTPTANYTGVNLPLGTFAPQFASVAYNPDISPYVFALWAGFTSPSSQGRLYVLDPSDGYHTLGHSGATEVFADISTAIGTDTPRDLVMDKNGNLYITGFSSTINIIPNALASVTGGTYTTAWPAALVDWYQSASTASFNGLDIGFSYAVAGDYNGDGHVDAADYVSWRLNPGANGGTPGGWNTWRANYATAGSGSSLSGGAVPEPTSAALLVLGVAAIGWRRRSS